MVYTLFGFRCGSGLWLSVVLHFLPFFSRSVTAESYGGLFFDPNNFTHAECRVPGRAWVYWGERNVDAVGHPCESWRAVTEYHQQLFTGYNQYYFPDEFETHSFCREVPLASYQKDPAFSLASAHAHVQSPGWTEGPWCYIRVPPNETKPKLWDRFESDFRTSPCFPVCSAPDAPPTNQTPLPDPPVHKYNEHLLDRVSQAFFSDFDAGNLAYYEVRTVDEKFSESYLSMQRIIFPILVFYMLLVISLILARHYWKQHKQAKARKETNTVR